MSAVLTWRHPEVSRYVSHCGTWMVQAHGEVWRLFRRTTVTLAGGRGRTSWDWGSKVFESPHRGLCQGEAQRCT